MKKQVVTQEGDRRALTEVTLQRLAASEPGVKSIVGLASHICTVVALTRYLYSSMSTLSELVRSV